VEQPVSINLRLPADLHAALKRLADKQTRSLNRQIVHYLRDAVEREEGPKKAPGQLG
jgi:hypothetical protein